MEDFIVYAIICSSVFLSGCRTAQQHIEKIDHHKQKAIEKGAVFSPDTVLVTVEVPKVIQGADGKDSLIYVNVEVEAECPGEIRYITKRDKRFERKMEVKEKRWQHREAMRDRNQKGKTDRTAIRQDNRTERASNRKLWWLWMLIGIVIGAGVVMLLRQFLSRLIP